MAAPNLSPIDTAATQVIMPGLADGFYKADPLTEMLKRRTYTYSGGPKVQENFIYLPMRGAPYAKGVGGFDISKRQTFAGLQFTPRYYQVSIPEFLEEIEIEVN